MFGRQVNDLQASRRRRKSGDEASTRKKEFFENQVEREMNSMMQRRDHLASPRPYTAATSSHDRFIEQHPRYRVTGIEKKDRLNIARQKEFQRQLLDDQIQEKQRLEQQKLRQKQRHPRTPTHEETHHQSLSPVQSEKSVPRVTSTGAQVLRVDHENEDLFQKIQQLEMKCAIQEQDIKRLTEQNETLEKIIFAQRPVYQPPPPPPPPMETEEMLVSESRFIPVEPVVRESFDRVNKADISHLSPRAKGLNPSPERRITGRGFYDLSASSDPVNLQEDMGVFSITKDMVRDAVSSSSQGLVNSRIFRSDRRPLTPVEASIALPNLTGAEMTNSSSSESEIEEPVNRSNSIVRKSPKFHVHQLNDTEKALMLEMERQSINSPNPGVRGDIKAEPQNSLT